VRSGIFLPQWRGRRAALALEALVFFGQNHRVHIFTRDETGAVYLPTQLERTLQLYW
jgi:hypothetical protein